MSRVGSMPITIPSGVTVSIAEGIVTAKGKEGELTFPLHELVEIDQSDAAITVKPVGDTAKARAMWGTTRARIQNLITGVGEGFKRKLELVGVGYRASVQGSTLKLQLGFSHDIDFPIPEGVKMVCENQNSIEISGSDKQQVGQLAAKIRSFRPPEPYKGKGVKYAGEQILRKEGKKK